MSDFRINKVLELPEILTPNTLYLVPGIGLSDMELYVSNNLGTSTRRISTSTLFNEPYSVDQPVTYGATITPPTKSTTKVVDFIRYKELGGKRVRAEFCYSHDAVTGAHNGEGQYTIILPDSMTMDTTKHRIFSGAFTYDCIVLREALPVGTGQIAQGNYNSQIVFVPYNNNSVRMVVAQGYGEQGIVAANWYNLNIGFLTHQGSFEFYRN